MQFGTIKSAGPPAPHLPPKKKQSVTAADCLAAEFLAQRARQVQCNGPKLLLLTQQSIFL